MDMTEGINRRSVGWQRGSAKSVAWWSHLLWVVGLGLLGFGIAALFGRVLGLSRAAFVFPHALVTTAYFLAYLRWSGTDLGAHIRRRWVLGLAMAALAGVFLVRNVLSQPASSTASGGALALDLLWLGLVYGTVDALLLSVLPVLMTWRAFRSAAWARRTAGRIVVGGLALIVSLLVTAAYHLGFAEFQGASVVAPVIGNGISTLAYLVASNPLGSIISHVAMHVAAVLHGPATVLQLPPHL